MNVKRAGPMKIDNVSNAFSSTVHGHEKTSISINFSNPINKRLKGKDNEKTAVPFKNLFTSLKKNLWRHRLLKESMVYRFPSMKKKTIIIYIIKYNILVCNKYSFK